MSKLDDLLFELAKESAEIGLHAKDAESMLDQLEELLPAYKEDIIDEIFMPILEKASGKHVNRTREKVDLWMRILTDYRSGMSATDIAKRYYNPVTGKHYSRGYIYWVIERLKEPDMQNAIKNLNK